MMDSLPPYFENVPRSRKGFQNAYFSRKDFVRQVRLQDFPKSGNNVLRVFGVLLNASSATLQIVAGIYRSGHFSIVWAPCRFESWPVFSASAPASERLVFDIALWFSQELSVLCMLPIFFSSPTTLAGFFFAVEVLTLKERNQTFCEAPRVPRSACLCYFSGLVRHGLFFFNTLGFGTLEYG